MKSLAADVEAALAVAKLKRCRLVKPWTWFGSDYDIRVDGDHAHVDVMVGDDATAKRYANILNAAGLQSEAFSTSILSKSIHMAVVAREMQTLLEAINIKAWSSPRAFVLQPDRSYR